MKEMKRFLISIIICIFICFSYIGIAKNSHIRYNEQLLDSCIVEQKIDTIQLKKDSIKNVLYTEVENYINMQNMKSHDSISIYIVEHALEYDIDLCFMMGQTQIETNFGKLGAGREKSRKSLFGVAIKRYDNYNDAVEDYCKILKKSYLVKGRDEQFLMNNYINRYGNRYAEDLSYESTLKRTYNFIKNKTKIDELQYMYESI